MTIDGVCSKKAIFRQGVPQEAVISPLLFLIYVDDLPDCCPPNTGISTYADDVAIYTQSHSVDQANAALQRAVSAVKNWSDQLKLTLSTNKYEMAFFTTNPNEAHYQPRIEIDSTPLQFSDKPKFLVIIFDRQLTFGTHAATVAAKTKRRAQAIRCLTDTDWGYDKSILRDTYIADPWSSTPLLDGSLGSARPTWRS